MSDNSVAKNYANAFVNAVSGTDYNLRAFIEKIKFFNKCFFSVKDITQFMSCPNVDIKEKEKLIREVALKANIGGIEMNFIQLLINNNRVFILPEIVIEFEKKLFEINNELKIVVKTESKSDDVLNSRIKNIFESKTGKKIIMEHVQDTSIIGGIIIELGNKMFDGSIKTQIENIKKTICIK